MQITIKYDLLPGECDEPEGLFTEVSLNPSVTRSATEYSHLIHDILRAAWLYAPNMGNVGIEVISVYFEHLETDSEWDAFWSRFNNHHIGKEYKIWMDRNTSVCTTERPEE